MAGKSGTVDSVGHLNRVGDRIGYRQYYFYFAMAFSVAVETLNIKMRKNRAEPLKLRKQICDIDEGKKKPE